MKINAKKGFTLVEVLVVISVIGMLMAMLLPAVQSARDSGRKVTCANNLRQVGMAYKSRSARHPSKQVTPAGWMAELSPYLEENTSLYVCPTAEVRQETETYQDALGWVVLTRHPGGPRKIACKPGPHCREVSGQFGAPQCDLAFEWSVKGGDWNDLVLRFEGQRNSRMKVTCMENDRGTTGAGGGSFGTKIFDPYGQQVASIGRWDRPGAEASFFLRDFPADYGMNNLAHQMTRGGSKILIVEYSRSVADVVGLHRRHTQLDWQEYRQDRHCGSMNVLYTDGHVKAHASAHIDPYVVDDATGDYDTHNDLWKPSRVARLSLTAGGASGW